MLVSVWIQKPHKLSAIRSIAVRSPNNTIYFKSGDHDTPENVTVAPQGCDPKTCVNPDTNAPYLFNDTCTIETFEKADCSSCSEEVRDYFCATLMS